MNINLVPPDLVDTELRNSDNIGSIYLIIVRNNSVSPPSVKRSINELIVTEGDIHFKYFTGGIIFPELCDAENDIIFPVQYYDPAIEEVNVYKINFDRDNVEMMKLIQSFVLLEAKK